MIITVNKWQISVPDNELAYVQPPTRSEMLSPLKHSHINSSYFTCVQETTHTSNK